jgi:hypothetical protein
MAGMLVLVIHSVAVEVNLGLTPAESERLRQISYERRLEMGLEKCNEPEDEDGGAGLAGVSKTEVLLTRKVSSVSSSGIAAA